MENKGWRRGKLAAISLCLALAVSLWLSLIVFSLSLLFLHPAQNIDSGALHRFSSFRSTLATASTASRPTTMHWRVPEVPATADGISVPCFRAATVDKVRWNLSSLSFSNSKLQSADYPLLFYRFAGIERREEWPRCQRRRRRRWTDAAAFDDVAEASREAGSGHGRQGRR